MSRIDLAKLRTISFGGRHKTSARIRQLRDASGRIATMEIDHPDGTVEAVARPRTLKAKLSAESGQVVVDDG